MGHEMVYGIFAENWQDIAGYKAKGFVDFGITRRCGQLGDSLFVRQCHDLGVSAILQNSDAGSGMLCGQDGNTYMTQLKNMGYDAVGGESETTDEMNLIQNYVPFYNMGGEWGGQLSDMFAMHPNLTVHNYGMVCYYETYNQYKQLLPEQVVASCVTAAQRGAKEVGFMIGKWMPADPQPYRNMVYMLESRGIKCSGFCLWNGYGASYNDNWQAWGGAIQNLMSEWKPDMRPLSVRMKGAAPPPPPPPPKPKTHMYHIITG